MLLLTVTEVFQSNGKYMSDIAKEGLNSFLNYIFKQK